MDSSTWTTLLDFLKSSGSYFSGLVALCLGLYAILKEPIAKLKRKPAANLQWLDMPPYMVWGPLDKHLRLKVVNTGNVDLTNVQVILEGASIMNPDGLAPLFAFVPGSLSWADGGRMELARLSAGAARVVNLGFVRVGKFEDQSRENFFRDFFPAQERFMQNGTIIRHFEPAEETLTVFHLSLSVSSTEALAYRGHWELQISTRTIKLLQQGICIGKP